MYWFLCGFVVCLTHVPSGARNLSMNFIIFCTSSFFLSKFGTLAFSNLLNPYLFKGLGLEKFEVLDFGEKRTWKKIVKFGKVSKHPICEIGPRRFNE